MSDKETPLLETVIGLSFQLALIVGYLFICDPIYGFLLNNVGLNPLPIIILFVIVLLGCLKLIDIASKYIANIVLTKGK